MTIKEAAERLRAGEVVAFPTETVYGLGANALDPEAVRKIYALKGRPETSPLIVHVSSIEMARTVVAEWPSLANRLAERWWPGPLSFVLPKQPIVPDIVTAGLPTVGVRMPNHPVALELIREAGVPIAAPSANAFTGLSPTTAEHVRAIFGDAVPVLDGGPCQVGIESTVISITDGSLRLLRPGMIHFPDLEQTAAQSGDAHPAPGMHHRHYSPRTPLLIVSDPAELPGAEGAYIWHTQPADTAGSIQLPREPEGYAAKIYAVLHELDRAGLAWIAVEALPESQEWSALRDRITRAKA